jgi:hypothetical protein
VSKKAAQLNSGTAQRLLNEALWQGKKQWQVMAGVHLRVAEANKAQLCEPPWMALSIFSILGLGTNCPGIPDAIAVGCQKLP